MCHKTCGRCVGRILSIRSTTLEGLLCGLAAGLSAFGECNQRRPILFPLSLVPRFLLSALSAGGRAGRASRLSTSVPTYLAQSHFGEGQQDLVFGLESYPGTSQVSNHQR